MHLSHLRTPDYSMTCIQKSMSHSNSEIRMVLTQYARSYTHSSTRSLDLAPRSWLHIRDKPKSRWYCHKPPGMIVPSDEPTCGGMVAVIHQGSLVDSEPCYCVVIPLGHYHPRYAFRSRWLTSRAVRKINSTGWKVLDQISIALEDRSFDTMRNA